MSLVAPHVYLSSVVYAKDKFFMKKENIKYCLVVGTELTQYFPNFVKYKQINIFDKYYERIIEYFPECINFILEAQKEEKNILVHCYGGQSRSVTIICAFVMYQFKINAKEAFFYVKERHSRAEPNSTFLEYLELWEKILNQYWSLGIEDFQTLEKMVKQPAVNVQQEEMKQQIKQNLQL